MLDQQLHCPLGRFRISGFLHELRHEDALPTLVPAIGEILGRHAAPIVEVDAIALQDQAREQISRAAESKFEDQFGNIGVIGGEQLVQADFDRLVQKGISERFIEQAELGIEPRFDGIRSQERRTKRVNRADPGRIERTDDRLPVFDVVIRARTQAPYALAADSLSHLPRGALGKRDRHEVRQISRICVPAPDARGTAASKPTSCRNPLPPTIRPKHAWCRSPPAVAVWAVERPWPVPVNHLQFGTFVCRGVGF